MYVYIDANASTNGPFSMLRERCLGGSYAEELACVCVCVHMYAYMYVCVCAFGSMRGNGWSCERHLCVHKCMCICLHVCVYVCVYVCEYAGKWMVRQKRPVCTMHVYMCVCMHVCMYVCMCMFVSIREKPCVDACMCMCVCVLCVCAHLMCVTCIQGFLNVVVCVYIYIYIYIYVCMFTYAQTCMRARRTHICEYSYNMHSYTRITYIRTYIHK